MGQCSLSSCQRGGEFVPDKVVSDYAQGPTASQFVEEGLGIAPGPFAEVPAKNPSDDADIQKNLEKFGKTGEGNPNENESDNPNAEDDVEGHLFESDHDPLLEKARRLVRELRTYEAADILNGQDQDQDFGEKTDENADEDEPKRSSEDRAATTETATTAATATNTAKTAKNAAKTAIASRDPAFFEAVQLQLGALGTALERLSQHPGLADDDEPALNNSGVSEQLLGVFVPSSPSSPTLKVSGNSVGETSPKSSPKSVSSKKLPSRDTLEVSFDLDEGHRVNAFLEFFPDGTASIEWSALELPVPLTYIQCLIQEVDLLDTIVPFIVNSGCLHEFPWNSADRILRVVSKPPIPFVPGMEAVAQRFAFDLLDTPWKGLCLVECSPDWKAEKPGQPPTWRSVKKPAPYQSGLKDVDVKTVVALGRPCGPTGQWTSVYFNGCGNLKVPRSLLPNWLIRQLVTLIGRFVYQRALEIVNKFDTTEYGKRLANAGPNSFYPTLKSRIKEHVEAQAREN
mmetsp:Transcript_76270/g.166529  ORF Transcript_76270/g.166529 Transcript_76270/m.166529 type:complete len:513 (-) Transcript_76270:61-1599(-)